MVQPPHWTLGETKTQTGIENTPSCSCRVPGVGSSFYRAVESDTWEPAWSFPASPCSTEDSIRSTSQVRLLLITSSTAPPRSSLLGSPLEEAAASWPVPCSLWQAHLIGFPLNNWSHLFRPQISLWQYPLSVPSHVPILLKNSSGAAHDL